jgi:hypothetical protein
MSCIPRILELKGDRDYLHIMDPKDLPADCGIAIEGGGEYRGFHYLITFTGNAHRCGYVALPINHVLADEKIDLVSGHAPEPYDDLSVHGGITFHENGIHIMERLFPKEPHCKDVWIGFDCAHYRDGKDWEHHAKYFGEEKMNKLSSCFYPFSETLRIVEVVRTYNYVESECKNLIDQLIEKDAA